MLNLKKKTDGFTIIEVLIVLAIAGLILLIVFLAVPALQRNSRNTQRKNDVATMLGAVNEFSNNNNGALPNGTWTVSNAAVNIIGAANTIASQAKLGYYDGTAIGAANGQVNKVAAGTVTAAATLNSNTEDFMTVSTGTQCDPGGTNASQAGPARSVTAVYEIENNGGGYAQVCQQS
jgi:prepilin-type N-terminal cleavage/methylation domain-containing protein